MLFADDLDEVCDLDDGEINFLESAIDENVETAVIQADDDNCKILTLTNETSSTVSAESFPDKNVNAQYRAKQNAS